MPPQPDALQDWPEGPDRPEMSPGEVHVWASALTPDRERAAALSGLLSAAERERASRFRFEDDAARYRIGRGVLRLLLARYAGGDPAKIALGETSHGRPFREHPAPLPELDFNLSHSRDLALFAVCRGARVGVDIEWMRPLDDMADLVEHNFSPAERAAWRGLAPEARHPAFFRCWTRKEAFVKAIGEGLSHPLDAFDVTFAAGDPPRLTRLACAPADLRRWSLYGLDVADGYAAALAVERPEGALHRFRLDPRAR